jgi:hypothetical protein
MDDREQSSGGAGLAVLDRDGVRDAVVAALADVRVCDTAEIGALIASDGGDTRMDSKEAEVIIARVEASLDVSDLVKASDLRPDQLTSVETLTALLFDRLANQ